VTGDFPHRAELKPKALQVSIVSQQRTASASISAQQQTRQRRSAAQTPRQAASAHLINQAGLHFLLVSRFILQT